MASKFARSQPRKYLVLNEEGLHSKWVAARREKSRNLTTQELENLLLDTVQIHRDSKGFKGMFGMRKPH